MMPMTAQRMMAIHSNAARPLPKPMLEKAAKMARMLIRRKKRMSTWGGFSSRDSFGSCAKTQNSDVSLFAALREIIAAHRHAKQVRVARHGGHTCFARRDTGALGVDERAQNGQRQIRVTSFD